VTLDKSLDLSESLFGHLYNGNNEACFLGTGVLGTV
jgi:hypothetical protein